MTERKPEDPLDAGLCIGEAFELRDVPYALGGALAYGIWGIPRATVDVDLNVFVEDDRLADMLDALASLEIEAELDEIRAESEARGMFIVRWDLYRIDVFTPSIDFAWEAARTRRRHEVDGRPAWFLSPEALAVFKLLFFRAKDISSNKFVISSPRRWARPDEVYGSGVMDDLPTCDLPVPAAPRRVAG